MTHGKRHVERPNLDDNAPQACPCTRNPELWQAVPFQQDTYCMSKKRQHYKIQTTETNALDYRENPENRLVYSRRKKLWAHATLDPLHGSRPNLDDCVRTAFLCRPC